MSSLKTLFVAALVLGALYVAYLVLNYNPEMTAPPEVAADEWNNATLSVDPGKTASTAPRWSSETSGSPLMPVPGGSVPGLAPANTAAPVAATSPPDPYPNATAAYDAPLAAPPAVPTPTVPDASPATPSVPDATMPPVPAFPAAAPASSAPPDATAGGPTAVPPAEASELARAAGFGAPTAEPLVSVAPPATETRTGTRDPYPPAASPITPVATPASDREDYAAFVEKVKGALAANRLAAAHLLLSQRYRDPQTPPAEAKEMEQLLDQLAGTVIYSPDSFLEAPYEVLPTDTFQKIADRYNVPTGLLKKINGLAPDATLTPGQRIKVVRGPFDAVVDATKCELTLLLAGERYAGRFPIGVGPELRQEGTFPVTDKKDLSPSMAGGLAAQDPSRGTRLIGLGTLTMHGTPVPDPLGRPVDQGCISLSQRDLEDLYDILSIGSTVTIRR